MRISTLVADLQLIAEDDHAHHDTRVAVVYLSPKDLEAGQNPIYKEAVNVSLKKVRMLGSDVDAYAIVLS